MLHQFTFKNVKSFKDETTLNLLASSIKEHPNDVASDVFNEQVLTVAAIYGANASGKSTVIDAFNVMRHLVLFSFRNTLSSRFTPEPYWFEDKDTPSEFSTLFSTNGNIYQHGFSYLNGEVVEEYLYKRDESKKKESYIQLFERTSNKISGEILKSIKEDTILELIEENTLLVSVLSNLKIESIQEVFQWYRGVRVVDYGNPHREMFGINRLNSSAVRTSPLVKLLEDKDEKKQIENFIQAIDVGITKLGVIENRIDDDNPFEDDETKITKRVVSYHKDPNSNKLIMTPISCESSGTQKMLMLYVDLKQILDTGGTIFIDELDAKLHPLLIRYIIIMFHDDKLNPNHAQLIFSTQEVFTLDKDNLRRDEIWFTDKDKNGVSELYSLDSYVDDDNKKIRNDASYGKDYILGRYKSIPSLKRMEDIDG
ncbi:MULTISPECIES: AAA family ATPase [Enterococcus]|uniref:AAA family ATPase n=1 Tax=Enterococcus TaxID=1350 RepID=UPI000CF1E7F3|nr:MULTISPECIES: ATP-binding protein [Enterococcus]EMC0696481.1 ATP-binding protein [Enterococcus faecalis]MDQ8609331.1 ATP-binding protein [Enterococcus sp. FR088]MDT2164544.1 ATP-binding protein [Enterococcus faecalis]NSV79913.1 ATP-binding protein [Enterococcus faecalis]PQF40923.1 ATP-binding protein [Enterococcus faecalis]